MLHCLKLKLKLHHTLPKKYIIISVAANLSFFTFNTKNNTNILHINIIYQPVEYYYFSKKWIIYKRIIWMQGARHGFINGKQHVKAADKHSVEWIVLLTLVYYFLVAVTNGTPTIYCLTGLLFTQSACTYQKFVLRCGYRSHIVCVCVYVCRARVPTVQFAHVLKGVVFRAQMLFNAYIFKQTRLKNACKWYNLVTTCSGPIWQVTNPSVLHAIGQSLLSSPGTPLENNRTT